MELFRSIRFAGHHYEEDLEKWLEQNLDVLTDGDPLLPIDRQCQTPSSGILDLLALDVDGNVVVVELKRGKAPRDAIAQGLEYAAWAAVQSREAIIARANRYLVPQTLARRWNETFSAADSDVELDTAELPAHIQLNEHQRIFLVVEGYDERITAVARYLRKKGVDFNLVTFHYYRIDSGEEMIDFEMTVGPQQDIEEQPQEYRRRSALSEEATISKWSPELRAAYAEFRDNLLGSEQEPLIIEPKIAGITFRKQMPDKRLYICTFEPGRGKGNIATIGIRKPSLLGFLDMEAVVQGIERDKPDEATITNRRKWLTIWCEPKSEIMVQAAELIKRHILVPLAGL